MAPPLIQLQDVGLTFGGTPLLTGVDLAIAAGERLCLVGRNGSGKSTLLRIAAGLIEPDRGTRFLQPGVTIRYLPQEPDFADATTTLAYVEAGLAPGDDVHQARYLLQQLGLGGDEEVARLSGGEVRRAAIARALAPAPDILLLDEPTNHLDLTTIEWLEAELSARSCAIVLISHDRRFLTNLSRSTAWLDRGHIRRLDRGFAAFEEWRDAVLAEEEREQHKLDRKIVAEEHWLRYGVSARRKRNVRRLGALQALRQSRREYRGVTGKAVFAGPQGDKSGTQVIEADRISKSYGQRPIVADFSIRIRRGDRIGIVGPNGSGKTTLLNILTGATSPDAGAIRLGANLVMATLDQQRESLDPNKTVTETLTAGAGDTLTVAGRSRHVMGYLRDFLFSPEQVRTPLGALSGGERGRLMLARALARPANVLVLDEPTNDLDLETLELLEEQLIEWPGTLLLVSHDRVFLDNVVTSTIVFEGDGRVQEYVGGYEDWVRQRLAEKSVGSRNSRPAPEPPAAKAVEKPKTAKIAAKPKKLSFKEQRELDELPAVIEALESEQRALATRIASAGFYKEAADAIKQALARVDGLQRELAAVYARWGELDARK
jgi:ATP-binding cassette subfamily F protein uup